MSSDISMKSEYTFVSVTEIIWTITHKRKLNGLNITQFRVVPKGNPDGRAYSFLIDLRPEKIKLKKGDHVRLDDHRCYLTQSSISYIVSFANADSLKPVRPARGNIQGVRILKYFPVQIQPDWNLSSTGYVRQVRRNNKKIHYVIRFRNTTPDRKHVPLDIHVFPNEYQFPLEKGDRVRLVTLRKHPKHYIAPLRI